jgi:tripartite-type tricarboxylate transporter receptor subunit TctC
MRGAGKLRALATGGLQRSAVIPEVPTLHESGVTGFEVIGWWGMLAPARAVLDMPEVRRVLLEQGMEPAAGTPAEFAALIRSDMEKWGDIGKRLGVSLD